MNIRQRIEKILKEWENANFNKQNRLEKMVLLSEAVNLLNDEIRQMGNIREIGIHYDESPRVSVEYDDFLNTFESYTCDISMLSGLVTHSTKINGVQFYTLS